MDGIDFSQQVDVFTLSKGKPLAQWQVPGNSTGNYFAPIGTQPGQLGINPQGRGLLIYAPTERIQVLRSTAAEIVDTWTVPKVPFKAQGGGIQYFTGTPNQFHILYDGDF